MGTLPETVQTSSLVQRRKLRRQQILDAAERCVRRAGFHGASISSIAEEAGISVGIIYRHFKSKEDIIEALVVDESEKSEVAFQSLSHMAAADIVSFICREIEKRETIAKAHRAGSLHIEVLSEATRNEKLLKILRDVDAKKHELAVRLCTGAGRATAPQTIEAKAECLSLLFDGLRVRMILNPGFCEGAFLTQLEGLLLNILGTDE